MGLYESSKKILASAHNRDTALVGQLDCVITRFCGGAIYIHAVLMGNASNDTYDGLNMYMKESTISTLAVCEQSL